MLIVKMWKTKNKGSFFNNCKKEILAKKEGKPEFVFANDQQMFCCPHLSNKNLIVWVLWRIIQ